jgi:hydrogenase maturation factor
VLSAALIGTAERAFRASDIAPGDAIYATKHIGIEGMAILASDRPDLLDEILTREEIAEVESWMEATSVLAESRSLRDRAVFMHDPTEGGFLGGLGEICRLAGLSADVSLDDVPLHPYTRRASRALGFDPLRLVASGSLIAIVPEEEIPSLESDFSTLPIALKRVGRMDSRPWTEPGEGAGEELWGLLKRPRA